jgi:amino acid adenylation domain-containing protein
LKNNSVALVLDRDISLFSSMCKCLDKNITYIPIDPNTPPMRINEIIKDANADVVITHHNHSTQLKAKNIVTVELDEAIDFDITTNDDMIAYIIFTSGSTGNPKGVEVTREGLFNFIEGVSRIIDFSPGKRIACLTTVSFDIFFLESVMALYKGLTVVLANEDEQRNPKLMANLIKDNAVDMVQMTPSRMQLLLNHDKELSCLKNVKEIMIGGEPFPLSLLRTLQEKTTAKIYNMYGPTETTIWSTISDLTHKDRIDIGRPIKNTEIYIVDENLSVLPNGQAGEICIAGKGLAKRYVGREDLTKKKFIHLPQKSDVRVYRTGDMGRYLPDGDIEYLGRTDNQVKIRGHRIELEEIESHINQIDEINQCVVIALEMSETDKILEVFYTSNTDVDYKHIKEYLSSKLPDYMIPAIYKRVESFIQTQNGKIDRKRVLECVEVTSYEPASTHIIDGDLNDIQKRAYNVIVSNLESKFSDVKLDIELSGAGIDSISFIKIVVALEGEFDFEFDDEKLLITEFPIIMSMIEYVESKAK